MRTSPTFRNILVATDFSPAAKAALTEGVIIADSCGAAITLVNVLVDPRGPVHSASLDAKLDLLYGDGSHFYREVLADSESQLVSQIAAVTSAKTHVRHKTLLGTPHVEVCRIVQHSHFDLVVLGKHSQSALTSLFIGSTAKRIIRTCPAPVLAVGEDHCRRPKRMLVAIDFSDASRQACYVALDLAQRLDATVDLLHVVDTRDVPPDLMTQIPLGFSLRKEMSEDAEEALNDYVGSLPAGRIHKAQLAWGNPWKEICGQAEKSKADWVVTGTVGRTGVAAWLLGSTAEQVLNHCKCSLLTVKAPDFRCPIPLTDDRAALVS